MEELIKALCVFAIIMAIIALIITGIFVITAPKECAARTKFIGYQSKWDYWGGCQILVEEGRWIPLSNWRYYEEPK